MKNTEIRSPISQQNYDAAVALSMSLADFERSTHSPTHSSFHLERMKLLANLLGNPQEQMPSIHVAGTKGKGSTCVMLASILDSSCYLTGLCTSPHLHSVTERIRLGLEPISKESFTKLVEELWPYVLRVGEQGTFGEMTWFEFMIGASFYYFKKNNADIQVIETGLGGRLDATNIVNPIMSVITSISLDHTAILGDTVAQITYEKAGIIKPNTPVVVAPQVHFEEVSQVVKEVAESKNSHLIYVEKDYFTKVVSGDINSQTILVNGRLHEYEFELPLSGKHQVENAATAICVAEELMDKGFNISKVSVEKGISDVKWSGRMEVLEDDRNLIIVDGAHNPYSIRCLVESICQMKKEQKDTGDIWILFGALKSHDCKTILNELLPLDPILIPVSSRHPKSYSREDVQGFATGTGIRMDLESMRYSTTVGKALKYVQSVANKGDLILATGSLSVVAEVIEMKKMIIPELYAETI